MQNIDIYLKVEVDLDEGESPERFSQELARMIEKMYSVRRAEVQNMLKHGEE
jgi:hypothetical protein